jgi:hypothetical protein
VQVAHTLKIEPRNVAIKVTASYRREGSIMAGTAHVQCDKVTTELTLDCDESPERIAQLIKMAEASCYTMAALRQPVDAELIPTVNGEPFDIERPV